MSVVTQSFPLNPTQSTDLCRVAYYFSDMAQATDDIDGTLADELEDRVDEALNGDVADADDVEDAFLS